LLPEPRGPTVRRVPSVHCFHVTSRLDAPPDRVWRHATSMAGVNLELAPLMRMTHPPELTELGEQTVPLGEPLFRSIILLFGVLPIDYDDVTFAALSPGKSFREDSRMLSMRRWIHERSVEAAPGGATLTDRITFELKVPGVGGVLARLLGLVFRNRHRNLVRLFGGEQGAVVHEAGRGAATG
jgi:ligand-binding SRPBCC domain-containing protein